MKLWSSFKKELILATRSFYFYVEVMFSVVILAVLLFAIPEHAAAVQTQYLYLDMPDAAAAVVKDEMKKEDADGKSETVQIEAGGQTFSAERFETQDSRYEVLQSEDAVRTLADTQRNIGAVVSLDDNNRPVYKYYLQGYESERLKNLISVLHMENSETLQARYSEQQVHVLASDYEPLNDRENTVPPMLAFSGSLMGMFIMAAYVFLDKKEGVIRAYAVTASSVQRYLLSKILVLMLTTLISGLIVVMPVMGFDMNYGLMVLLLMTSAFFASALGLLLASFYQDIAKAFGMVFFLMILLMLPSIAYFLPGWNPVWVRVIPSYPLLQGFKESLLPHGDAAYALIVSAGFLAAGAVLFGLTNVRFKKTLSV